MNHIRYRIAPETLKGGVPAEWQKVEVEVLNTDRQAVGKDSLRDWGWTEQDPTCSEDQCAQKLQNNSDLNKRNFSQKASRAALEAPQSSGTQIPSPSVLLPYYSQI